MGERAEVRDREAFVTTFQQWRATELTLHDVGLPQNLAGERCTLLDPH